jgi:hypothetical protein
MGDIGRSHLNIYRQILEGCKAATTKYVAMAEDDILYSESHFHSGQIAKEFESHGDVMLYDMNKVSYLPGQILQCFPLDPSARYESTNCSQRNVN